MQNSFMQRRNQLVSRLESDALVILRNPAPSRNRDILYPYRPDSNFYYLTGISEPDTIAIILPKGLCVLFCHPREPEVECWIGRRLDPESAVSIHSLDEAYTLNLFDEKLKQYLKDCTRLYYDLGRDTQFDLRILQLLQQIYPKIPQLSDVDSYISELRLKKTAQEIALIEKAVEISTAAHLRAIAACRPQRYEYQIAAEILHEFYSQGTCCAYETIVASGRNGCTLHYTDHHSQLQSGDLLLIDAGCEYHYYASDITRTIPISGRFSEPQKAIYQIVLQTQTELIRAIKPGVTWDVLQNIAIEQITDGLIALGLLQGTLKELIQKQAYRSFFMHGFGHWLGLDVHDVGRYRVGGQWRALEAGMVLTVEPGIYISNSPDLPDRFHNLAVRIEDDVLVTESSCRVLSAKLPKTIDDISALFE